VLTWLEHHANIVLWQCFARIQARSCGLHQSMTAGKLSRRIYQAALTENADCSFPQVSNALGTVTPAQEMIAVAHRHGACVLVDGAQAVSHMPVNVQALDCDFYVFSAHKVFAPTGIGVLYGKPEVVAAMPPWQGGGYMIADVTFGKTVYQAPPLRFEAGTGNIADAVGLGAAIDYLDRIGMANIAAYEHGLLDYATKELLGVPGLTIVGTAKKKAGVISFELDGSAIIVRSWRILLKKSVNVAAGGARCGEAPCRNARISAVTPRAEKDRDAVAHLKRILKLNRLRLRGPCGARDEFLLAAIAQNLRKLAKLVNLPPLDGGSQRLRRMKGAKPPSNPKSDQR
jgi:selenocysteine lyase/cysteine desulfurase